MVQKAILDNGIRVITENIPTAHSATLGFWIESGSRHEDPAVGGVSHFIEHMLFKGTPTRTALEIAREIDSVGGVLNAFTSREYSCYYAKVLARKLPLAIDLLSDVVLNSAFDPADIEKERKVIFQEIFMEDDTPDDQVHDLFSQMFWRGHPLGYSILGTRDSVKNLSREALMEFMKDRYRGDRILICAAGDLNHEEIVDRIAEAFHEVTTGCMPSSDQVPDYDRRSGTVEKDLEQVHLCLGTRALPHNHPNRFELQLLNTILGGSMSSRLFQKVREEEGLAYSIYSYLNCHSDSGALVVYAGASPENIQRAIEIILEEFRNLKENLMSEEELRAAKEQIRGYLLLSMESTDNRMSRLAKNEIYMGRNLSLKEVLGGFGRVSREGIQKLANFILQDQYINLQTVGKLPPSFHPETIRI